MKTLLEIVKLSEEFLAKKGISSAKKEAEMLVSGVLGMSRMDLYLQFERPLNQEELDRIRERLKRRGEGEPLPYIEGAVEFYRCDLQVNSSVLIPRQETEVLVDKIVKELKFLDLKGKRLLDLCTGSGGIGLAIKKEFPDLEVLLSDISEDALRVAQANAQRNQLDVKCLLGDFLEPLKMERVDFVVCNPPYISKEEFEALSPEVKEFEPHLALFGGEDGLRFYRQLKEKLPLHLYPHGRVWLEIGAAQGAAVSALFSGPVWKKVVLEKDWSGRDRFISLEFE
ncbi:MAG: peptide chain release factor N(5)-glutamine methyltransferase [Parachlamydiaceae bacterium]